MNDQAMADAIPMTNEPEKREYDDHHVYGGKGALSFAASMTRGSEGSPGKPTVMLEGAKAVAPRKYNWAKGQKVSVQFTLQELPVVAAVFLGVLPSCEFKNHGPEGNKWFSIENQGGKFFVKVGQAANAIAVPMTSNDAFYVTQIVLDQIKAGRPSFSHTDTMQLIARMFRTT